MTFARPIDLRAGPTPGTYVFLAIICLLAILVVMLSSVAWTMKLAAVLFAISCLVTGWIRLNGQRGWQIIIFNSGAINIGPAGRVQHPAELERGAFCSRALVTLPLQMTGRRRRYFLINPAMNNENDFRRLRVWLNVHQAYN